MKSPTAGIRVVAPFLPLPAESELHQEFVDFDWIAAIRMLFHSVALFCQCPVHVITDAQCDLPVPRLTYTTTHRRLMLWTLEACLRYLESDDFDRDTVMLDCDQLVFQDLAPYFPEKVDLGVLVRPTGKHQTATGMPFLNGVQFWALSGKTRLVAFYRRALDVAATLSEDLLRWGADQAAVLSLLQPLNAVGTITRSGVRVRFIQADTILEELTTVHIERLARGRLPWPTRPVLDFRWKRKLWMAKVYEATILREAVIPKGVYQ